MFWFDSCRADDHPRAVRGQDVALVLADLVRAHEHACVTLGLRNHRQAHTGIATGWLYDRATRLDLAFPLCSLDHLERDPILDRAARIEVLNLRQD